MTRMTVTPELAEQWLGRNTKNRALRQRVVQRYAKDMRSGDWLYTGEAIKFAEDGRLLDGQHRLAAVMETGISIDCEVVRGLDENAQDLMDTGVKRTAADMLALRGVPYVNMVAAAARVALGIEAGYTEPGNYPVNHSEVSDWFEQNPDIVRSCERAHQYARRADCIPAVVAYTHYMMSKIDDEAADQFWAQAATKAGLDEGDPVLAMANKFSDIRRNNQRLRHGAYISMVYRAWNARRQGRTMQTMKLMSNVTGERARIPELVR